MHQHGENLTKWRHYLQNITSPDIYIDVGFYFMIAAALQRRVFTSAIEKPVWPNLYVILVGPPSVGKGAVINPIIKCLKYHKRKIIDPKTDAIFASAVKVNEGMSGARVDLNKIPRTSYIENLFHSAPDCTTFEGVVRFHADALRLLNLDEEFAEHGKDYVEALKIKYARILQAGRYPHSSIHFALEEMSSLFRKNTEDVVNYLVKSFDGENYDYRPKTEALQDLVVLPVLNFLAGTQPSFLSGAFDDKLVGEGFCARTIFTYADKKRFVKFNMLEDSITEAQIKSKDEIVEHLGKLGHLFGQVGWEPGAHEFLRYYIEEELPRKRANYHPKLEYYYGRKDVISTKLSMAVHFADSLEMKINMRDCEIALEILEEVEKRMHLALTFKGQNPLAEIGKNVVEWLEKSGPKTYTEILEQFYADLRVIQLNEVIAFLVSTDKIRSEKIHGDMMYRKL